MIITSSYQNILQWLQAHMLTCPSKKYLHIECPGCGFQRSVLALLHGDVAESWSLYPATIPMMILVVFTIFHLKFKFEYGAVAIKYMQLITGSVILIFYIYKIVNNKIIV